MKKLILVAAMGLSFALVPFATFAADSAVPPELGDLLKTLPSSPEASGIPQVRFAAMRETGMNYGSQAGLARRTYEIIGRLNAQANSLDVVYNFGALMMDGNVVPPVLVELNDVYDQASDDLLRVIGKVYRIEQQARFTYAPPTWRSYLLMNASFDTNLVAAVSPKTAEETAVWKQAVADGFKLGTQLADDNVALNLARLQRDFKGMILYHRMLADGMVTKPFVGSSNLGVTRAPDGSMHVGEVVLKITANPDFVDSPEKWREGAKTVVNERLKKALDPANSDQMLRDARKAGLVKEQGR